jgi:hypothetical protein
MNHRHRIALMPLVLILAASAVAGEKAAEAFWGLKDSAALAACRRWQQAEQRAWQGYSRLVVDANGKLRQELEAVQQKLTDSGQLEEALKVKQAVEELKAGKWPSDSGQGGGGNQGGGNLAAKLDGTRWRHTGGWTFTLDAKTMTATTTKHPHSGTWAVAADGSVRVSVFRTSSEAMVLKLAGDNRLTGIAFGGKEQHQFTLVK